MKRRRMQMSLRTYFIVQFLTIVLGCWLGTPATVNSGRGMVPWGVWFTPKLSRWTNIWQIGCYRQYNATALSVFPKRRPRGWVCPTSLVRDDEGWMFQTYRGKQYRIW